MTIGDYRRGASQERSMLLLREAPRGDPRQKAPSPLRPPTGSDIARAFVWDSGRAYATS
jgi:hypothetical protein